MVEISPPNPVGEVGPEMVQAWLRAPIPRLYINGYAIAQSAADMGLVLMQNGAPISILSMSYITAKTLAGELQAALQSFEKAIGQEIKTIHEITAQMMKEEKSK